ncbi:MAG: PUR family DNA/RNA-binding protein [Bacteroidales bacterium]|nr:PUR family DNA/RNA-binding protein [Bacteroidales bacterium]MCF8458456.1 PUR family DNA/RNA-binding protein [Bacteroidales bacterium]
MGRYDKPENLETNNEADQNGQDDIFSRSIRAGKRTYFFDVKSTRRGDYYLTLTESKKHFGRDGDFHFEKHKIFLYKEDFEKFMEGLTETLDYCNSHNVELKDVEGEEPGEETDNDEELKEFGKKMF